MKGETGRGGEGEVEKGCLEETQVSEQMVCYIVTTYHTYMNR